MCSLQILNKKHCYWNTIHISMGSFSAESCIARTTHWSNRFALLDLNQSPSRSAWKRHWDKAAICALKHEQCNKELKLRVLRNKVLLDIFGSDSVWNTFALNLRFFNSFNYYGYSIILICFDWIIFKHFM